MAISLLNADDTVSALRKLLTNASKEVWLVTPYFDPETNERLVRDIRAVPERGVQLSLVIRPKGKHTRYDLLQDLAKHGARVYEVEWLHAKLYWSERSAIVTSLNLIHTSLHNSVEAGILVDGADELHGHVRDFMKKELGTLVDVTQGVLKGEFGHARDAKHREEGSGAQHGGSRREQVEGFCIRCGDGIPPHRDRPYCHQDFETWREYENPDYPERYCHLCGSEWRTTKAKPLCGRCFDRSSKGF